MFRLGQNIVQVAEKAYGAARSEQMAQEMAAARAQLVQDFAKQIVNQNSPGRYSEKK